MSDPLQPWETPEGLASIPGWLPWCCDPAQRLIAAKAYRGHPNQAHNSAGKADRYEAAALALGYSAEVSAVFREFATTPAQATRIVERRRLEAQAAEERRRQREIEEVREERFRRSPAGRRKARRLRQGILQVHYCNDDFGVMYVTSKVWHALMKTPAGARLIGFRWGTLGEHDGVDGRRIYQSPKAARRDMAFKLKRLYRQANTGLGGLVGMRMQGWQRAEPEPEVQQQMQGWFERRILPWIHRQIGTRTCRSKAI